jgi:hypothetical protein
VAGDFLAAPAQVLDLIAPIGVEGVETEEDVTGSLNPLTTMVDDFQPGSRVAEYVRYWCSH